MRTYLIRVLGVALLSALAEVFLPEGNMRRAAAPVIGLATVAVILVPAVNLITGESQVLWPAIEKTPDAAVYADAVGERYKAKIIEKIKEQGGEVLELCIDETYKITHVTLEKGAETKAIYYITTELGVPRREIEVR